MEGKAPQSARVRNKNRTRNKINRKLTAITANNSPNKAIGEESEGNEKFAWSKLQTSPEPSELPIPNFILRNQYKLKTPKVQKKANSESDKVQLLKNTFSKLISGQSSQKTSLNFTQLERITKVNKLKDSLGMSTE